VYAARARSGARRCRRWRGLARALHVIHAAGVVHRDLKPANVIVVDRDPVVIDFGLAHVLDATRLTRTGTAIGTPGYLAPEILDGERAGPAADVFSWAGTVAFAATGRSPYGPGPAQAIFSRVLRGRYDLNGVPGRLRAVLEAALAIDPDERPGTGDLLEALAVRNRPRPTAAPRRPRAIAAPDTPPARDAPAVPPGRNAPAAPGVPPGRDAPAALNGPLARDAPAALDGRPARNTPAALDAPPDAPEMDGGPGSDGGPAGERPAEPGAGGRRRGLPMRLLRGAVTLAVPAACYALPVFAVAMILSACAAGYAWDAITRARRRTAARAGRLARLGSVLAALVAVPAQTVVRLVALVVAMAVGYGAVLGVTWWSVVPRERALALPLGVLIVVAAVVRARYGGERRPARLVLAVLSAGALALAVLGIPFPAWWPVTAP
jgi:hypothetical protein